MVKVGFRYTICINSNDTQITYGDSIDLQFDNEELARIDFETLSDTIIEAIHTMSQPSDPNPFEQV